MDLFSWSVPFLMEKVSDMLMHFTKKAAMSGVEDKEPAQIQERLESEMKDAKKHKFEAIKKKIRFIGRMNRILKTLRSNQEEILKIKEMAPDGKVPIYTILGGSEQIHRQVEKFYQTRITDYKNEAFPVNSRRVS
jgi:hypothetical protein